MNILVIVCLATVLFNLIVAWLNFKLYTEFFKQLAQKNRVKE